MSNNGMTLGVGFHVEPEDGVGLPGPSGRVSFRQERRLLDRERDKSLLERFSNDIVCNKCQR